MESRRQGHNRDVASLKEEILSLGLEDDIPLAELAQDPDVLAAAGAAEPLREIRRAMGELVAERKIYVLSGHWSAEPTFVADDEALALVADVANYEWQDERVFYVNRDNVLPEFRPDATT